MLSASDLRRCRDTVEQLVLPGTAVLYAPAGTADGMGGVTESFQAAGTVACRIDYRNDGGEPETGAAIRETVEYVMTVSHTVTVPPSGRVHSGGEWYDVTALLTVSPWDLCQRVTMVRTER